MTAYVADESPKSIELLASDDLKSWTTAGTFSTSARWGTEDGPKTWRVDKSIVARYWKMSVTQTHNGVPPTIHYCKLLATAAGGGGGLEIMRAWYGGPHNHSGPVEHGNSLHHSWLWQIGDRKGKDVTSTIRSHVRNGELNFNPERRGCNDLFGFGHPWSCFKILVIQYRYGSGPVQTWFSNSEPWEPHHCYLAAAPSGGSVAPDVATSQQTGQPGTTLGGASRAGPAASLDAASGTPVPYSRLSIYSSTPVHGWPRGEEAQYLLDEATSAPSNWGTSKWNAQTGGRVTLEITVNGPPIRLSHYALKSANDYPNRDPRTWSLSAEPQHGEPQEVHRIPDDGRKWAGRWQWREWQVAHKFAASKFYLTIEGNHGDVHCTQLGQLRLFECGVPEQTSAQGDVRGTASCTIEPRLATELAEAAWNGEFEKARSLLEREAPANTEAHGGFSNGHHSALNGASRNGHAEIVTMLLNQQVRPDLESRCQGPWEVTPLQQAAFWGRAECAKILLAHGASTSAKSGPGCGHKTAREIAHDQKQNQWRELVSAIDAHGKRAVGAEGVAVVIGSVVGSSMCASIGSSSIEGAAVKGEEVPPLIEIVELMKRELGLTGNVSEVVREGCAQLGVSAEGKTLIEQAKECWLALA